MLRNESLPHCLTTSHISSIITFHQMMASVASFAPYSLEAFFILFLSFSRAGRDTSPFAIRLRPAQPGARQPFDVSPQNLAFKAVKSQFSDKSNLDLSGDAIYRSETDRAAWVAVTFDKYVGTIGTCVWSQRQAGPPDPSDEGMSRKWVWDDTCQGFYFVIRVQQGPASCLNSHLLRGESLLRSQHNQLGDSGALLRSAGRRNKL